MYNVYEFSNFFRKIRMKHFYRKIIVLQHLLIFDIHLKMIYTSEFFNENLLKVFLLAFSQIDFIVNIHIVYFI